MSAILEGLNQAQKEAISAGDGPVLVLAGPGSGKTRVLTHRIAYLVEQGIPPWRIMAVTFTNKAAREMRHRVEELLGGGLKGARMGTFHSVCAYILRREADYLPITSDYVIYDTSDQRALMKEVITVDLDLNEKQNRPERVLNAISRAKNELVEPDDYPANSYPDMIIRRAYERYQQKLATSNAVDFDDLLMMAVQLFQKHPEVLKKYQDSYEYVLVDEFQDTNSAQYQLVKLLAGERRNLFCVGDEDQSIYSWRGADYRNVRRLREDYPDLHTILLEQNYRSTQLILDAARSVIDLNPHRTPKKLFTDQEGGPEITVYEAYSEDHEAEFVVNTIAGLVGKGEVDPGGCAVMYRTNAQSRALEDAFIRANLPYRLVGATRFYGRREVKDVVAYMRIIHNPNDQVSMLRVINTPPRSIGKKTIEELQIWASSLGVSLGGALVQLQESPEDAPFSGRARNALLGFAEMLDGWRQIKDDQSVSDLLKLVLDETGYRDYINDGTPEGEDRWANVMELVNVASEFEELTLAIFLEEISLVSEVDNLTDESGGAPTLLTLHAAKGLEFDVVFLTGLEEGVLPHNRSLHDVEGMAEERRLMYVGMTRARKRLYLLHAFQRTVWGRAEINARSRFVDDIPANLTIGASAGQNDPLRRAASWSGGPPRLDDPGEPQLKAGQRVFHAKFGEGIVIQSKPMGNDVEVSVAFEDVGIKRLLASFANLEMLEG